MKLDLVVKQGLTSLLKHSFLITYNDLLKRDDVTDVEYEEVKS